MEPAVYRHAVDYVADAVLLVNRDGVVRFANRSAGARLERDADRLVSKPLLDLVSHQDHERVTEALRHALAGDISRIRPDPLFGSDLGPRQALKFMPSGDADHVLIVGDGTAPMRGQGAGATREDQDPVTGLLNRRSLPLIVQRELYRAGRGGISPVAMLFVMLRDFKDINQMHGHQVGDLLLENTGIRIRETVRKSDYTFRWEGTNIVVLLPELATRLDGLVVAEKIHSAVTVPYRFRGLDLAPGCHIGIALYPDDAADADELFNRANSAVIEAEKRGEACLYFDRETHQRASDRLTLKTALQRAFEGNELELFYQPIVHRDGSIAGAEALMRWNHPTRGLIGPAEFIEVAEDSRLIAPIDKLALYTVCRKLVALKNHPELFLTLNVSAINLSDASLPQVVSQAIKHTGLTDPSRLVLEITESRAAENRSRFLTVIEEIQDMGVKIWIDDFGTGESSLSYLKHLPISTVKIDKDFVAELETDAADMEYLSGIISTVRSRRKSIVIEGVATVEQAGMLRNLAVEYLQGFYFARPVPAGELDRMLSAGTGLPMD